MSNDVAVDVSAAAPAAANEAALTQLLMTVEQLQLDVREANTLSRARERIIDRLHEENQRLRAEALDRLVEPLLRELLRLADDLEQSVKLHAAREPEGTTQLTDLRSYHDAVLDILYRQGVEPFEAVPGSAFDGKTQRALTAIATEDATRDRTIARVVRPGFRTNSRVLRPLEAEVYRHTPSPTVRTGGPHGQ